MSTDELFLKNYIRERAFVEVVTGGPPALAPEGHTLRWFFDFRTVLFEKDFLERVSLLFWEKIGKRSGVQVGGLESAALPLITACILSGEHVTGFYIRKSRKKKMEMKQVEGTLTEGTIILVDDVLNSGGTFKKQVLILEKEGKKVDAIFSIVRFRDMSAYTFFTERGIQVFSLFTLEDFNMPLLTAPFASPEALRDVWYFAPTKAHFFPSGRKSQPSLRKGRLYLASDSGYIWCLSALTGEVIWKRLLVLRTKITLTTFTDVAVEGERLYVGASNGSLYELALDTGKVLSVESVGERFIAKPIITARHIICGVYEKSIRASVVALNRETKAKVWSLEIPDGFSGHIAEVENALMVGDSAGTLWAVHKETGAPLWKLESLGRMPNPGRSTSDGKRFICVSENGHLHEVEIATGKLLQSLFVGEWLHATPWVEGNKVFLSALDKCVYCVDLVEKKILWEKETEGRIFSEVVIQQGVLYVGNNEGVLYMLDTQTGRVVGKYTVTERITNPVILDGSRVYLTTFAGEVYGLELLVSAHAA